MGPVTKKRLLLVALPVLVVLVTAGFAYALKAFTASNATVVKPLNDVAITAHVDHRPPTAGHRLIRDLRHRKFDLAFNLRWTSDRSAVLTWLSGARDRSGSGPGRMMGLTTREAYKGVTWGNCLDAKRNHFTFYPIYDWAISDVWKAIHDHGWPYS